MLHVVTMLWDWDPSLLPTSRCFDESWVEKLYRGFNRNLTIPFKFVVFTDRPRKFSENEIHQEQILSPASMGYGRFTEPYRLGQAMIFCGLDTLVVGNIDHLAQRCLDGGRIALCRDPYQPTRSINGIALVPPDHSHVYETWTGQNDMEWLRTFEVDYIDDVWPGHVLSLKFHDVRRKGLQGAKVIYFHGSPKAHELMHLPWVREHWV